MILNKEIDYKKKEFLLAKNLYHDWISAIDISVWIPFSLFISVETWPVNKSNETSLAFKKSLPSLEQTLNSN